MALQYILGGVATLIIVGAQLYMLGVHCLVLAC
jgi:hypothetical protein